MSNYTSYSSSPSNCGCPTPTTVSANDAVVVPAGSTVIQSPCEAGSVPNQSSDFFTNPLAASSSSDLANYFWHPEVASTFVTKGIDQVGNFRSNYASNWGLPGMIAYFPGLGLVEIVGVSNNTVTYKNKTIEQGTEINTGFVFAVGVPKLPAPAAVVTDGGSEPVTPEDGTQFTRIYGANNGVYTQIEPVQGQVLMGIGNKWQRVLLGQGRYPVSAQSLLSYTTALANRSDTITLPSKPTIPDGKTTLGVEVDWRIGIASGPSAGIRLTINGQVVGEAYQGTGVSGQTIVNLANTANSFSAVTNVLYGTGTMGCVLTLKAYYY